MGTHTFSPQWPKSFRHVLLLPSPSLVYNRRKLPNLRVSVGASAPQLQTLRLRIRSHAGACPPPAQRTTTGYAGRRAEVVEARSIAAFDWRCDHFWQKRYYDFNIRKYPQVVEKLRYIHRNPGGWPTQARFWLEWGCSHMSQTWANEQTRLSSCHGD